MKIFMIGGTGLLGSEAAKQLINQGHEVTTLALPDIPKGCILPKKMKIIKGNYLELSEKNIKDYMKDMDAFIFAAGIDDRVEGTIPIYDLFKKYNIDPLEKMIKIAKFSKVKHIVVLGSYFCYFDKIWKDMNLALNNPYIRSRVDQENMALSYGDKNTIVSVLELPYIFGVQKGRKPVWTIIISNILKMKRVTMFPKGGTAMVTVKQVGECIVGCLNTKESKAYPVGYFNMEWTEMLDIFHKYMGYDKRKIITIPTWIFALVLAKTRRKLKKEGKETGLNMPKFAYAMSKCMFIDKDIIINELGVTNDDIKKAIKESVIASMEVLNGKNMTEMKL